MTARVFALPWVFALLLTSHSALAISANPRFGMSEKDRSTYLETALRSVVAVIASDDSRRCSGTLVSRTQVLTSAHCFDAQPGQAQPSFDIYLMNGPFTIGQKIKVRQVHIHPLWLMGNKAIADWNSGLKNLYAGLNQISKNSGATCSLKPVVWEKVALSEYFNQSKDFVAAHRKSRELCASSVVKIYNLLAKNRALLDQEPLPDRETRPGDLAVAELSEEFTGPFHRPMKIDYNFETVADDDHLAFISGFGVTDERNLLAAPFNSLSVGFTDFRGMKGSDLMEIAGSAVLCKGDSGGPTAYVKHKEMILVGVNAGSSGCNFRNKTSQALTVKAHADWLQSIISRTN